MMATKKRLTKKEREAKARQAKINRLWRKSNPNYWKKYFQEHKEDYHEAFLRYSQTKKGQISIAKYEQSDKRRQAKTDWMRKARQEGRIK